MFDKEFLELQNGECVLTYDQLYVFLQGHGL